ncbi:ATP-binding protein [Campylobacter jejuni]|uniref:ATP-binding protein n=2 Tax=Campylobacter jejuni TaxID=197 RepID=UPI0012757C88|nr:ATP-binding protein [Campylobacter jejuni]EAJ8970879.1 ATP-binding protein [Campylobacter jejuni]ECV6612410.1 ATP-binding protein [Campylobacter jejuni]EFS2570754.1 ATP-binding protein [Campylobacter jejuni]EFV4230558.1 ATP-binding protein [Campylobacter jejuni]EHD2478878.1 ATP-binding protein [Campylobacter jejuni]
MPEELKKIYNNLRIIEFPNKNDILNLLRENSNYNIIVLTNQEPFKEYENLFVIKKIKNKFDLLSSQHKEMNFSEEKILEMDLGLSVIKSPFTLKDIGGAKALKEYTNLLIKAEKNGFKAKGVFLVGIPGTGKTFFPKCFAGELDRKLILLNLSQIMESNEPIQKLNNIFEFLHKKQIDSKDEKYVILIDEIEKMIGSSSVKEKQMLGRLLTILNDINTPACEYSFNAIFFATANDLNSILKNNPEFLRRGRWDELFFINLPTHENAEEMFNIYIKKYNLKFVLEEIMNLDSIFAEIEAVYQKENPISNRFPYTPAEIENFCKRLDFCKKAKGDEFSKKDVIDSIQLIIPLVKSAKEGIEKMVAQSELFIEI